MLIHPAIEGQCAIVRDVNNQATWQAVLDVNCSMDECPVSGEIVETGTMRAWHDIVKLKRVALLTTKGCGSNASSSGRQKLVCIVYKTVAAATLRLSQGMRCLAQF